MGLRAFAIQFAHIGFVARNAIRHLDNINQCKIDLARRRAHEGEGDDGRCDI
jgi:hypothetical protein